MKTRLATLILLVGTTTVLAQDLLKIEDLKILDQTNWQGQLTYKDYSSGKLTSIDAAMQVYISDGKVKSNIQYTYEPHKNHTSTVKIRKNGTYYGNELVLSNELNNGIRTFVTTYEGKDNSRKATMYITHVFSEDRFTVIKDVQYHGTDIRFMRNKYEFKRIE